MRCAITRKTCLTVFFSVVIVVSSEQLANKQANDGVKLVDRDPISSIHVPRCCPNNTLYRPHLDVCSSKIKSNKNQPRNVTVQQANGNWITIRFVPNSEMMQCPEGEIGAISEEFYLTNNTSLQLTTLDGDALEPTEYCMDENFERNSSLFVRYCTPDPCYNNNDRTCIKKCCPPGTILNDNSWFCEATKETYDIVSVIKDGHGRRIGSSDGYNQSYTVVSGHGLKCNESHVYLGVNDEIRLINGRYLNPLKLVDADNVTYEYCVDYVNTEDAATVSHMSL